MDIPLNGDADTDEDGAGFGLRTEEGIVDRMSSVGVGPNADVFEEVVVGGGVGADDPPFRAHDPRSAGCCETTAGAGGKNRPRGVESLPPPPPVVAAADDAGAGRKEEELLDA